MRLMNVLAIGASLAFALAPVTSAAALPAQSTASAGQSSDVLVSIDGTEFSRVLERGLFDENRKIVPGSAQSATLYVKNNSARSAVLALHATHITVVSIDLARALTLRASTSNAVAAPVSLASAGSCLPLLTNIALPAHTTTTVVIDLSMAQDVQGSTAQGEHADFDVLVTLRDASEPALAGSGCDGDSVDVPAFSGATPSAPSGTGLAATGSNLYPLVIGGGLLLGIGAYVVVAGRRRKRNEI